MPKYAPEDHPDRCQGITRHGQCKNYRQEDSDRCEICNPRLKNRKEKMIKERYLIDQQNLRDSYNRQVDDPEYLSLRQEIALVQALLERRINCIQTDADMIMSVQPVATLIQRLESMKISLMKIQEQMGLVLSKESLQNLASEWAHILADELQDLPDKESRLDSILTRIYKAVQEAS